jgi:hypothetical protein
MLISNILLTEDLHQEDIHSDFQCYEEDLREDLNQDHLLEELHFKVRYHIIEEDIQDNKIL